MASFRLRPSASPEPGRNKVIVSQERLLPRLLPPGGLARSNHPLISSCILQSRQTQYTCEVRSVPASNLNRPPVILALRAVVQTPPALLPEVPLLCDPIIVTLTYFRTGFHSVQGAKRRPGYGTRHQ